MPIECVARGYLAGSGLEGIPADRHGLRHPAARRPARSPTGCPRPIFTPATKAESGHDVNISDEEAAAAGRPRPGRPARGSSRCALYAEGAAHAERCGIIVADTKFEFGLAGRDADEHLLLIDEVLTPDSSRFWPADRYEPGRLPAELRQAVRARLPGSDPVEQAAAGAVAARRGRGAHAREVPRGLPPADRPEPRVNPSHRGRAGASSCESSSRS